MQSPSPLAQECRRLREKKRRTTVIRTGSSKLPVQRLHKKIFQDRLKTALSKKFVLTDKTLVEPIHCSEIKHHGPGPKGCHQRHGHSYFVRYGKPPHSFTIPGGNDFKGRTRRVIRDIVDRHYVSLENFLECVTVSHGTQRDEFRVCHFLNAQWHGSGHFHGRLGHFRPEFLCAPTIIFHGSCRQKTATHIDLATP